MSDRSTSLVRSINAFSLATAFSRILGYFRDAAVAYYFGGGGFTDAYYAAFRISNLFRRVLGEGGMAASAVPVFSATQETEGAESAKRLFQSLSTGLFLLLLAVTLLGILFAKPLVWALTYGFAADPRKLDLTVQLTRTLFPYLLLVGMAALYSGILHSLREFFLPALSSAGLSVAVLAYLFFFPPRLDSWESVQASLHGLAVAAVGGGMLHWGVQILRLRQLQFPTRPRPPQSHPGVSRALWLLLPAAVALSVEQINSFVDTICASFLQTGSLTALYNSNRIMQLPLALFGIAAASVALPSLSASYAQGDWTGFTRTFRRAIRWTAFILLPASAGLVILGLPIVRLLFERGRFTPAESLLTQQALLYYALGLVFFSCAKILANAFYAIQNPKIPVRVSLLCVAVNAGLNLLLMGPLGIGGLALATTLSSALQAGLLARKLKQRIAEPLLDSTTLQALAKTLCNTLLMSCACWFLKGSMPHAAAGLQVLLGVSAGVAVYLSGAYLLGLEELRWLRSH
ncbi:MAG: murein biosynthesis integral membrane protein MurJ [Elusimicrobia bacterium]|nr:murein biosynthesis integral membrane protein MurJ [Elusimicrobiota bacterium]